MTRKGEIIVEDLSPLQAKILKVVGWLIGIKGDAFIGFLDYGDHYDCNDCDCECNEPTINDLVKAEEESAMNRVSKQTN